MSNEEQQPDTYAKRKKKLLAEGANYRSVVTQSKQVIHANLSADMIAHNAVSHLTSAAYGAVNNLFSINGLRSGRIQKLLPLVITGYTALSRRSLLKPVLKGAAIVGVLGTVAVLVFRNKKSKTIASDPVTL